MSMTNSELAALLDEAESNSIFNNGEMANLDRELLDGYNQEKYGDEEEGRSGVVTSDIADTVDSDMTSLSRVFLGAGDVVEFQPTNGSEEAVREAQEKNLLVRWIINGVEGSYKKQSDLLKSILLLKFGCIEYGIRDISKTETKTYYNIEPGLLVQIMDSMSRRADISKVEIIEADDTGEDGIIESVKIRMTYECQEYFIENVQNEDLIISAGAQTKDDADVFGKWFRKRRGELIEEGFDKEIVNKLPAADREEENGNRQIRFKEQGGTIDSEIKHKPNDIIQGMDVYALVDFDGDGVPERRHIIKVGGQILLNEPFNHVPFAGCSAIQMPGNMIGKSRAEIVKTHQRVNSVLVRNLLDNTYQVNLGRIYRNTNTVEDESLLAAHKTGVVDVDGDPRTGIMHEQVPYTGTGTLQAIQYRESQMAKSTGQHVANQALTSDSLNEETATRFNGVEEAGKAKIELVARNVAEIVYRDLYEGIAWFANHYQNKEMEIMVLGKPMSINPNTWMYDHRLVATVGTGAGDDEKMIETLASIKAIQDQEAATGTGLVDAKKRYNAITKIAKAAGIHNVNDYFNDPEQPEQMIIAQNEQLMAQVQQLTMLVEQLQQRNPLLEVEQQKAAAKAESDNKKLMLDAAELEEEKRQFNEKMRAEELKRRTDTTIKLTEIEAENNVQVPGGLA